MAMMKAMIQKPLPPENAAPAAHAVQPATWPVPEDIQQQLSSLQSQVLHLTPHHIAGPTYDELWQVA